MPTINDWFTEGQHLQDAHRFADAECLYRRVLDVDSNHLDAWHNLAVVCAMQDKLADADEVTRHGLAAFPDNVDLLTQRGITLARQNRLPDAIATFRRAIELKPDHAKAHNNLGVALAQLGRRDEALECHCEAARVQPDYAEAHFNMAVVLSERRLNSDAIAAYERALQVRPDFLDALFNIGMLLLDERRADDALIYLEQAVRLAPNHPEAHNNLGLVLADLGRFDEALASCDTSLRFRPLDAKTHMNRGNVFSGLGRMGEAIASYDYALRLKPDYVNAVWNRSLSFLALGDFVRGFAEYESRWQKPETKNRSLPEPRWDGSPLDGKTILLWCEQGMGDMIQFIRYAFELKNRGASVWVECPEPLVSLLVKCPAVDRIIAEGTPLPAGFDCHAPVMSLPSLCRTSLATVPVHVPYLVADPGEVDRWRNELGATLGLKIGITWQGNPRHRHDRHRSFSVQRFRHVAQLDGVTVYSLQKGTGIEQLQAVGFPITDLRGPLDTAGGAFCNTAAAIEVLDLVITCDSAVAHLAGALGKPVWMPLSDLSDWRWLREREDSPWYPTMRIFRQPTLGDWATVFERILDAVRDLRDQNPQLAVHRTIPASDKVVDWPGLLEFRAQARAAGKTVVWTNGCFDLLHVGHVRNLHAARAHGAFLVVGVNSDASVRRLKGDCRPIVPAAQRAEILAALACVDRVIVFDEDTPAEAIKRLKPDVHCKGVDYSPPNGKPIPEAAIIEAYGGRIEYLPMVADLSTSDLVGRIRGEKVADRVGAALSDSPNGDKKPVAAH